VTESSSFKGTEQSRFFFPHLRTETDPVSETSCFYSFTLFLITRRMDKVRKPNISENIIASYNFATYL
jgi:hypothetical protein